MNITPSIELESVAPALGMLQWALQAPMKITEE